MDSSAVRPPKAAPKARKMPRLSILTSPPRLLRRETIVIVSTVVPDRKLIWELVSPLTASMTGLMMTPPPIPLSEPSTVAKSTVRTMMICISSLSAFFPILYLLHH